MKRLILSAVVLVLIFTGCGDNGNGDESGIKWTNDSNGTITVINHTSMDVVLFKGQTPIESNILGGVSAFSNRIIDFSDKVNDFEEGGFLIMNGISLEDYNKNKSNPANVTIRFSAYVIYKNTNKFIIEIPMECFGSYYFRVNNGKNIGIQLRKGSFDGEVIGFVPPMAKNHNIYVGSSDSLTIYPVYVIYDNAKKTGFTVSPNSIFDIINVTPRPISNADAFIVNLPLNNDMFDDFTYDEAIVKLTNNLSNQAVRLINESNENEILSSLGGSHYVNGGTSLTYYLETTDDGEEVLLNISLYAGSVIVPVKQNGNTPIIKNGYNYTITLEYNSGDVSEPGSYTAAIVEGDKIDIFSLFNIN